MERIERRQRAVLQIAQRVNENPGSASAIQDVDPEEFREDIVDHFLDGIRDEAEDDYAAFVESQWEDEDKDEDDEEQEQDQMSEQDRQYMEELDKVDWSDPEQVARLLVEARDHRQQQAEELQERVFGLQDKE